MTPLTEAELAQLDTCRCGRFAHRCDERNKLIATARAQAKRTVVLEAALRHQVQRNHPYRPDACSGCDEALAALREKE